MCLKRLRFLKDTCRVQLCQVSGSLLKQVQRYWWKSRRLFLEFQIVAKFLLVKTHLNTRTKHVACKMQTWIRLYVTRQEIEEINQWWRQKTWWNFFFKFQISMDLPYLNKKEKSGYLLVLTREDSYINKSIWALSLACPYLKKIYGFIIS